MIKTILIDDHKIFCDGLEKVLNETGQFTVIQKFYNGKNLLEYLGKEHPDMVLMDIEMPGFSGLDVIPRIRLHNPEIKIVILSMHEESVYSKEAYNLGANAYLTKSVESSILINSLLNVQAGEKIFPANSTTIQKDESPLSDREEEVLKLIAKGHTSEQIAEHLKISHLTIKAHRRNILRKLNVSNSAELIKKAMAMGLL
ncbi:MAG TPA: response regulator transcription factor [Cyclobacteriaceae bacterium]